MFSNLEFIDVILIGIIFVYLVAVIVHTVKLLKYKKAYALLFVATMLLLPVASCMVLLIAVGNSMTGLMSMGILLSIVLLGSVLFKDDESFLLKRVYLFVFVFVAWYQISAVTNDQLALKEGKTATVTLVENVVSELISEGYLEQGKPIALIGQPAQSPLFVQSSAYQIANTYARFGCFSTDARNSRCSYSGVMSNYLGISINLCSDAQYEELRKLDEVADMPSFPSEDSIREINDVIVVKISDLY